MMIVNYDRTGNRLALESWPDGDRSRRETATIGPGESAFGRSFEWLAEMWHATRPIPDEPDAG